MACRCTYVEELYGDEAETYAREHLHSDALDEQALVERLSCPDTGRRWLLEYPDQTQREAGQARLRLEQ